MERIGGFDAFWSIYPRKIGKLKAQKAYDRATKDKALMPALIMTAIQSQLRGDHFKGSDGQQYVPNPATWLNQKRWEDDLPSVEQKMLEDGDWKAYAKAHGLDANIGEGWEPYEIRIRQIMRQEREEA